MITDLRTVFKILRVGVCVIQPHTKYVSEVPQFQRLFNYGH